MTDSTSTADSHGAEAKPTAPLRIAIIGGGIVGVATALGLLRRGMEVRLYEQASSFREIGAGVAFTTNAQRCMERLSPDVLAAMKAVSTKNDNPYYTYVDGYRPEAGGAQLFQLHAGDTGFDACHRAHFLDGMVRHLPRGVVAFEKRFRSYARDEERDEFLVHFEDGSTATADAVIGCDGVRSRVRQVLLGPDSPAAHPGFTHQVCYRGLVDMKRAAAALGAARARNQCMYMGPGAHLLTFPVAQHTLMNVVAFARQEEPWAHERLAAPASRDELAGAFRGWQPVVGAIIGLLGGDGDDDDDCGGRLDKWAIFDTMDHPAPSYARGGACIAGDAAHATSPHHGAGAGAGIEDGLALAVVLGQAAGRLLRRRGPGLRRGDAVAAALRAYDAVRRERSQWLVRSSREVSQTYEWANPACGADPELCLEDIRRRAHRIWHFDIDGMVDEAVAAFEEFVGASPSG